MDFIDHHEPIQPAQGFHWVSQLLPRRRLFQIEIVRMPYWEKLACKRCLSNLPRAQKLHRPEKGQQ